MSVERPADRRAWLAGVRTIVVKIGTNVLTRPDGEMAIGTIHGVVEDLADLMREGYRVILVSSGAVSFGMHRLGASGKDAFLADKQAYAAVGQIRLMAVYQQALGTLGISTGQILLTEDDFQHRHRYLNLRNTMNRLLELGVLPVVNENDSISTLEIEEAGPVGDAVFGDNDVLSALVASKLGADLLLLLSDVEGLFADGPPTDAGTPPLDYVEEVTPAIDAMAGGGGPRGRGGMSTKLRAVQIATQSGCGAVIANGRRQHISRAVLRGDTVGTFFPPRRRLGSRKRWIAFANRVAGTVSVNDGARKAIVSDGRSLLFAGVLSVDGTFQPGDVVSVEDESGREVARGIANYSSDEVRSLAGKQSAQVRSVVGRRYPELIHRDNLATYE